MQLTEADRLLQPEPLALETGYERLPDGVLHVACRTDLHGCTGEMFEWWFRFRPNTQQYVWWHPVDHLFSEWEGGTPDTHVGSTHVVEECFTGLPAEKALIQFRDPGEFFDAEAYRQARAEGRISAAVCGRIGLGTPPSALQADPPEGAGRPGAARSDLGWNTPRLADGRLLGGRLLHMGRDTPWGCALRSHFYLGQDLPAAGKTPAEVAALTPEKFGIALLQHCYNEFTFLSRFLPSLFIAENRKTHAVVLPW